MNWNKNINLWIAFYEHNKYYNVVTTHKYKQELYVY